MDKPPPGLIIAAPASGSGKTVLTLGILRHFQRNGTAVAPFKTGPDYIDAAYLTAAGGRDCVNLDGWSMRPATLSGLIANLQADAGLIIGDGVLLVIYYYAWDAMKGRLKWLHIAVGAMLNLVGSLLMFIANAWTTFMMSPAGVTDQGTLVSLSEAIQNPLWWPINIHRLIANVAFGGSIAAGYAAIRFLNAKSDEERSHYDWMGYVGNFVATACFYAPLFQRRRRGPPAGARLTFDVHRPDRWRLSCPCS